MSVGYAYGTVTTSLPAYALQVGDTVKWGVGHCYRGKIIAISNMTFTIKSKRKRLPINQHLQKIFRERRKHG